MTTTRPLENWFEMKKGEAHQALANLVDYLQQSQSGVQSANVLHYKLYSAQDVQGLSMASFVTGTQTAQVPTDLNAATNTKRITLNAIKPAVDTLVAKMAKNKIKPTFLTDGGDWKKQRQAKTLNKFVSGLYYDIKMPRLAPKVLKSGCIFGTSFLKVFPDPVTERVVAEKVMSDEIVVDPADAYYGNPNQLYQVKFVSKQKLKAQVMAINPKLCDAIDAAQAYRVFSAGQGFTESVIVYEGWSLPTDEPATNGRHVVAIKNATLEDEAWTRRRFPFAVFRYSEPEIGYFGTGIPEEVTGIQIEINRILRFISQSMHLINNPRIFVNMDSKVNSQSLTNKIGGIVPYQGQAPIIQAAQAVHPENFNQLENLYRKAFETIGISQLSAQSKNPLGANASGRAMREFHDIETERFALTGQAYEDLHIDTTTLAVEAIQDILRRKKERGEKPSYRVKSFNRKEGLEVVDFAKIDFDDDCYVLQCFPTSALPSEPSARIETIKEIMQAGGMDPEDGFELMDFPDLDAHSSLVHAPKRLYRKQIEQMLDDQVLALPEPYHNLKKCLELAQLYYHRGQLDGVPDTQLEVLRTYMDRINDMLNPPPPAVQPLPPAPAPTPEPMMTGDPSLAPQAVPEAAPVSPYLPTVPGVA